MLNLLMCMKLPSLHLNGMNRMHDVPGVQEILFVGCEVYDYL